MTTERDDFPEHLTFSQRHGYEPLPVPMRLEEISDDLRREIWNACYVYLKVWDQMGISKAYFVRKSVNSSSGAWGKYSKTPENRVNTGCNRVMKDYERVITELQHNNVLDFLEIMIDEQKEPYQFAKEN